MSTMAAYPQPTPSQNERSTPTPSQSHIPTPAPLTQSSSIIDFNSPSAFLNSDAYASNSGESTPHYDFDHSTSSSMSMPHTTNMDDMYNLSYTDFTNGAHGGGGAATTGGQQEASDHPTPSGKHDEQTPVVPEGQQQIHPSTFPAPDHANGGSENKPLLSPFRQDPNGMSLSYSMPNMDPSAQHQPQQYMDPNTGAIYFATGAHHHYVPATYYDQQALPPPPPQFAVDPYQQQSYYNTTPQYFPGPPRSQHGSPTSSIGSSGVSLPRSTSTSSDFRAGRPKVKLTFEDKRNIVELHHSNSSLRQEDIARQYGVDRSTISKIILAQHRWTQPPEQQLPPPPKVTKAVGGRFPAIETMMHEWMDEEIAAGRDVRDNIAREKAKEFARRIGFPMERFKASAKWLDKFKERRKASGKPINSPIVSYGLYSYPMQPYPDQSMMYAPPSMMLSRSQSAATLSSSGSSQEMYQPSPNSMTQTSMYIPTPEVITPARMPMAKSETDLLRIEQSPTSRARSQSSPQQFNPNGPATQSPSSGKANKMVRPSPLSLQRQNSYHGTSPSPRRPALLTRSNTSQIPLTQQSRRTRPTSLAASAFGITPIVGGDDSQYSPSPLVSPATSNSTSLSSVGGHETHARQRSDASLAPFTNSMSGMTISPDMSDSSEIGHGSAEGQAQAMSMCIPPLTPVTPATHQHGQAVFQGSAEYANEMGLSNDYGAHVQQGVQMHPSVPDYGKQYGGPQGHPQLQPQHQHQPHHQVQHQATHPHQNVQSTPMYGQDMTGQYVAQQTDHSPWQ